MIGNSFGKLLDGLSVAGFHFAQSGLDAFENKPEIYAHHGDVGILIGLVDEPPKYAEFNLRTGESTWNPINPPQKNPQPPVCNATQEDTEVCMKRAAMLNMLAMFAHTLSDNVMMVDIIRNKAIIHGEKRKYIVRFIPFDFALTVPGLAFRTLQGMLTEPQYLSLEQESAILEGNGYKLWFDNTVQPRAGLEDIEVDATKSRWASKKAIDSLPQNVRDVLIHPFFGEVVSIGIDASGNTVVGNNLQNFFAIVREEEE